MSWSEHHIANFTESSADHKVGAIVLPCLCLKKGLVVEHPPSFGAHVKWGPSPGNRGFKGPKSPAHSEICVTNNMGFTTAMEAAPTQASLQTFLLMQKGSRGEASSLRPWDSRGLSSTTHTNLLHWLYLLITCNAHISFTTTLEMTQDPLHTTASQWLPSEFPWCLHTMWTTPASLSELELSPSETPCLCYQYTRNAQETIVRSHHSSWLCLRKQEGLP